MTAWIQSVLDYWRAGGALLIPLAVVNFALWAQFLRARGHFLRLLRMSEPLPGELAGLGADAGMPHLREAVAARPGGLSDLLQSSLADIHAGAAPAEAFPRHEAQARRLWRRELIVLRALTAVAPLLGLLGTVQGMIHTFDAVAGQAGDPAGRVAGGISTALITTQLGLIIALPGVFGLARVERLLRAVEVRVSVCRQLILAALTAAPMERAA